MVALKGNPDEEFEPITTAQKTRNRLPPKKNRWLHFYLLFALAEANIAE